MVKRLYRSKKDILLGGVCGGFAKYFDLDPVLVRIIWFVLCFVGGIGILAYLLFWVFTPLEK
jgi:phage shock protein PspC (stress-responsive transcriptional regulator)